METNLKIIKMKLILKKENTSLTETTFLGLHLYGNESQIQTSLYDKKNTYNFHVVRFQYKSSTIPSKMFFATNSAEILQTRRVNASVVQFIKTSEVFLHQNQGQRVNP